MNIKNIFFTIILLGLFAATSMLALHTAKKVTMVDTHEDSENNPDFFMTDAVYTKFNPEGGIRNQIQTDKITHLPTDNVYLFENPNITLRNPNEEPWYITAKQGQSEKGRSKIYLWDSVKIIQKAGAKNSDSDITTDSITFYPDTKFAETDQAITITQHGDIYKSVGAEIDFKTAVVKLLSKIELLYKIN